MSNYKRGVCPECKVKESDSGRKILYPCRLCDRWFCAKHFEPKLVHIPDYGTFAKYPEVAVMLKKETREDGHPDFEYSLKKFKELDMEKKLHSRLIEDALNRSKAYRKPIPRETEKEGKLYFVKEESPTSSSLDIETRKTKTRKPFPIKKVVGLFLAIMIIGALLWYAPTIISYIQNLSSQPTNSSDGSYTTLTLLKSSSSSPNFTSLTFGDIDYFFDYSWQGYLLVSNSLLETESYRPTNGSVFRDIGIEIKVSEAYSDHIVLFVKPTIPDYLAQSSFTKLTIAQGQYQTVNFSGNEYTIGYLQNPPYYVNKLIVATPLLQSREYSATSSQIINCDLGLEIRVYKATSEYIIIFVKPSY